MAASSANAIGAANSNQENRLIFHNEADNLVTGIFMLATSIMAFSMDLTTTFFAEATAWTFAIWGGLLLYHKMLNKFESYEITDRKLIIRNPIRFWDFKKEWRWADIYRFQVIVKRQDAKYEDVEMQIFSSEEGEIAIEREDGFYNPELARLIIEKAGLSPTKDNIITDLVELPKGVTDTYIWE